MQITAVLGAIAGAYGLASISSPLLQLRRMRRCNSSRDVSLGSIGIGIGGSLIWLLYGLSLPNLALIVVDIGSLATGLATLTVALHLRRHATDPAPALATAAPARLPRSRRATPKVRRTPAARPATTRLPGAGVAARSGGKPLPARPRASKSLRPKRA